ncbi:MAG TPA: MarR family transcriptional regulator [Methylovirgula sp.]
MARAASELTAHLGYWLRFVSNHVSLAFARKLESRGVTVAEWVVLRELYASAPVAPSEVAERLGLTRGAITKLADRLIAKSLPVRRASLADGRAQRLGLTAQGRLIVPGLSVLADENDAEFFAHLSARDRADLKRILHDLVVRHGLKIVPTS